MADDKVSGPPVPASKSTKPVSEALLNDKVRLVFLRSALVMMEIPNNSVALLRFRLKRPFFECQDLYRATMLINFFVVGPRNLFLNRTIVIWSRSRRYFFSTSFQAKSMASMAGDRIWCWSCI